VSGARSPLSEIAGSSGRHYSPAITHYERLGVATAASADEIRAAYRRRARELHPDVRPNAGANLDAAGMAAVNEAWRVLSDVGRRRAYDTSIGIATARPPAPAPAPEAPSRPEHAFVDGENGAFDPLDLLDVPVGPMEARSARRVALMLGATLVVMGTFVIALFVYAFFRSGTLFP
jgi:hypothetical protein